MKKKQCCVSAGRYPPHTSSVKEYRAWQQTRERELRYHPETALFEALGDMGLSPGEAAHLWRSGMWEFCLKVARGEAHILDMNLLREALCLPRVPIPIATQDTTVVEVDYSLPYEQLPQATPNMSWDFYGAPQTGGFGPCGHYLQNGVKRRTIIAAILEKESVTKKDIDEALDAAGLRHALVHEAHAFFRQRLAGQIGNCVVAWGTSWFFDFMGDRACGEEEYVPVFRHHCPRGGPIMVSMCLNQPEPRWNTQTHHFLAVLKNED